MNTSSIKLVIIYNKKGYSRPNDDGLCTVGPAHPKIWLSGT